MGIHLGMDCRMTDQLAKICLARCDTRSRVSLPAIGLSGKEAARCRNGASAWTLFRRHHRFHRAMVTAVGSTASGKCSLRRWNQERQPLSYGQKRQQDVHDHTYRRRTFICARREFWHMIEVHGLGRIGVAAKREGKYLASHPYFR